MQRVPRGLWLWLLTLHLMFSPLWDVVVPPYVIKIVAVTDLNSLEFSVRQTFGLYALSILGSKILALIAYWYAAYLIGKGTHRGDVHRIVVVLWCFGPGVFLLDLIPVAILFGAKQVSATLTDHEWPRSIFGPLLTASIWTSYLVISKHVLKRYPPLIATRMSSA